MTRRFSVLRTLALTIALTLTVAACVGRGALTCPTPLILDQTSQLVRFVPGGSIAMENLDFHAEIKVTGMTCGYKDELLSELEVNMDLEISAVRGAGNTTGVAEFEYFVAITDVRGTILNKQVFDLEMDLGEVGEVVTEDEGIWQKYEFLRGQSGQAYRVWSGFQMTERDLEISRMLRDQ